MGSPRITEELLPELKSISVNQHKGHWAESTARDYFLKLNYAFVGHRKKLKFGEVDLMFQKSQQVLLVEVKYLHNEWMSFQRISRHQKKKIILNVVFYQSMNPKHEVKALLCLVDAKKKITIIEL